MTCIDGPRGNRNFKSFNPIVKLKDFVTNYMVKHELLRIYHWFCPRKLKFYHLFWLDKNLLEILNLLLILNSIECKIVTIKVNYRKLLSCINRKCFAQPLMFKHIFLRLLLSYLYRDHYRLH